MIISFRVRSIRGNQDAPLQVGASRVILGGYSARSADERQRHVEELRRIGIEPPAHVPMFWNVSAALLTTGSEIQVQGERTSGEAEYALVATGGRTYVAVASDQTDRELERHSIPRSKQLCAKVLSPQVVPLEELVDRWDTAVLTSEVSDDGERWLPYQRSTLAELLPPGELTEAACGQSVLPDGTVLLSGTIPIVDGETRYLPCFRASLTLPDTAVDLRLQYRVEMLAEDAGPIPTRAGGTVA